MKVNLFLIQESRKLHDIYLLIIVIIFKILIIDKRQMTWNKINKIISFNKYVNNYRWLKRFLKTIITINSLVSQFQKQLNIIYLLNI